MDRKGLGGTMWERLANGGLICTSTGGITSYCGKCDLSMLESQWKWVVRLDGKITYYHHKCYIPIYRDGESAEG